jgi:hypothetical protein
MCCLSPNPKGVEGGVTFKGWLGLRLSEKAGSGAGAAFGAFQLRAIAFTQAANLRNGGSASWSKLGVGVYGNSTFIICKTSHGKLASLVIVRARKLARLLTSYIMVALP